MWVSDNQGSKENKMIISEQMKNNTGIKDKP